MKNKIKLSIVIPCYNEEKNISQLKKEINSILNKNNSESLVKTLKEEINGRLARLKSDISIEDSKLIDDVSNLRAEVDRNNYKISTFDKSFNDLKNRANTFNI